MHVFAVVLVLLLPCCWCAVIPDQDWGYVTVRQSAHMFWWLYGMSNATNRDTAPLVVWLQGGPGASSTGFGNFQEIGPLDTDLKPRSINWVQSANILFIDNPVGTGYSYVDEDNAYATSDKQIGVDLVALLKGFLQKYPNFEKLPFWIFCESYGGKMTTAWGVELINAIKNGDISINFRGVALGDSWVSPMSFVATWADYLLSTSEVDEVGWAQINKSAAAVQQAVDSQKWFEATNLWGDTEGVVSAVSAGVNFYNILDRSGDDGSRAVFRYPQHAVTSEAEARIYKLAEKHLRVYQTGDLDQLMNGPIKKKLGIPSNVTWGGQSGSVFQQLSTAFMQPIVDGVDFLLNSGVQVVIYSGNLDLICCTPGTMMWLDQLKWPDYPKFQTTSRRPLSVGTEVAAFLKTFKNLQLWNILSSGHMVPADQPATAQLMLNHVIYGGN